MYLRFLTNICAGSGVQCKSVSRMAWKGMGSFHVMVLTTLLSAHVVGSQTTSTAEANETTLVVDTTNGKVRGFISVSPVNKSVRVFYGIPYAKPPMGQLRFAHPQPVESWHDVFNATMKPNSCVQVLDYFYGNFSGSVMWNANTNMSEDCLKLNVWTPDPPGAGRAVLVWIYGGGFYSGTSTLDVYDARTLVSLEDVIVVSMNYRVASLGFLSFGNELAPGNAGLYDQQLALKWVKENIEAFGGNASRVTIFGESAGAVSVAMHLLSNHSRGFFSGAILQSGSASAPWGFHDNHTARESSRRLAEALNCSRYLDNDTLQCLRGKDPMDIVLNETNSGGIVDFAFVPVEDGNFTHNATKAISQWPKNTTHVLLGSNTNEGSYFLEYFFGLPVTNESTNVTDDNLTTAIKALNPVLGEPPIHKVLLMYKPNATISTSEERLSILDGIVGDYHFTCPVVQLADFLTQSGASVYQYLFARRSSQNPWPKWMGVIHGEEVAFEFGEPLTLNTTSNYEEADKNISGLVMRYWANFAKTRNPNLWENETTISQIISWPVRTTERKEHLVLNTSVTIGCAHKAEYCTFWESIRQNWTKRIDNC